MHRPRVILYFTLLMGSAASAEAAEPVEVRLRSSAICQATIVRLADIAELRGDDPARNESLGAVAIAPVPEAGGGRELSQHEVRQLLAISGIERAEYIITGSESVVLQADAASAAVARPALRRALAKRDIRAAAAEMEIVPAEVRTLRPQAYAERPKEPRLPQPAPPQLVERGGVLTVHSRAAGVQITTSGKALAHGAMGETVAVELAESRQRILAKVVAPQTVEVGVPAAPISAPALLPILPTAKR